MTVCLQQWLDNTKECLKEGIAIALRTMIASCGLSRQYRLGGSQQPYLETDNPPSALNTTLPCKDGRAITVSSYRRHSYFADADQRQDVGLWMRTSR